MVRWKEFEIECAEYLKNKFGMYATFTLQGGSNSTVPDILVETKQGNSFYIDVKHSPAQCGQFVLLPNIETNKFDYSQKNINKLNKSAQSIMSYMDENFYEFRNAGTAGKTIEMPNGINLFSEWIIQSYKNKGTDFFITNDYTILPVNQIQDYFDVTAKFRVKRSGSSNVGESQLSTVQEYVMSQDYQISDYRSKGDKLFFASKKQLHNHRFISNNNEYMFSSRGNEYELRKLSNTYNANVIFSIQQKPLTSGMSDDEFINCLK